MKINIDCSNCVEGKDCQYTQNTEGILREIRNINGEHSIWKYKLREITKFITVELICIAPKQRLLHDQEHQVKMELCNVCLKQNCIYKANIENLIQNNLACKVLESFKPWLLPNIDIVIHCAKKSSIEKKIGFLK